ncbi:MAG: hypothetical protein JW748_13685 [Anaerolineales bacterium]|nr:hypothetical protein [Anaerolineales bacterium]
MSRERNAFPGYFTRMGTGAHAFFLLRHSPIWGEQTNGPYRRFFQTVLLLSGGMDQVYVSADFRSYDESGEW